MPDPIHFDDHVAIARTGQEELASFKTVALTRRQIALAKKRS